MKTNIKVPRVTVNGNAISDEKLLDVLGGQLSATWQRLRSEIASGRNADGGDIKPGGYSPSYLEAMRKGQVSNKGTTKPFTETVNLLISGSMLGSVQQKRDGKSEVLFFNDAGDARNVASQLLDRGFTGWFELGQEDLTRIDQAIDEFVEAALAAFIKVD